MRVMVMVKATEGSEAGEPPTEQLIADMGKFNEELVNAGIMKAGDGLKPSSAGVRVHFSGATRTVTDGPFAETKELVAGFWLWEVTSMEEAVEWVKRCPNPMYEDSDIDIRPLYDAEEFAEWDTSGEFAQHEESLRKKVMLQACSVQPYLFFSGRCEEALGFYEQALGAMVTMKLRFNESPDPLPEGMLQPGFENKIMHASFKVGQMTVMASDGCDDKRKFEGFRLTLTVPTADDCDAVFDALAAGGTVDMPLAKTFWSPRYGMVTDKFGVGWMVMAPGEQTCGA
ncbi:MAG: VOC family protein [Planctomycetales bacterium]|nr:VOC family protein [Planctomycetales bacterium]